MWEERTLVETSIKGLTHMCLSDETSDDGEVVIGYNDGEFDTVVLVWNVESVELLRRTKTFAWRCLLPGLLIIEEMSPSRSSHNSIPLTGGTAKQANGMLQGAAENFLRGVPSGGDMSGLRRWASVHRFSSRQCVETQ